jgi:RecB family exonuclease
MHNALRKFGMLEMEYAAPNEKKQLTLFTSDQEHSTKPELSLHTLLGFWRESFIAEGYENRTVMTEAIASGEAALRHFFLWWQTKKRTVIGIEKSFSFRVDSSDDLMLSGRFDRIERTPSGLVIIDYKSSGPRPEETLKTDLQLSIYAHAATELWQEAVSSLTLLSITASGITEQVTTRTPQEIHDALTSIRLLSHRMKEKDYAPTPSVNVCKYCPYREICPARTT